MRCAPRTFVFDLPRPGIVAGGDCGLVRYPLLGVAMRFGRMRSFGSCFCAGRVVFNPLPGELVGQAELSSREEAKGISPQSSPGREAATAVECAAGSRFAGLASGTRAGQAGGLSCPRARTPMRCARRFDLSPPRDSAVHPWVTSQIFSCWRLQLQRESLNNRAMKGTIHS